MEPPAIRRRGGGAEDRISGLPDEILHVILSRVPSAADAARASVLSGRWRDVWANMPWPELVFGGCPAPLTTPSALLDSIDAALKPPAAPTFGILEIDASGVEPCDVPANRISAWLQFASQRIAGKLCLHLDLRKDGQRHGDNREELALPICVRATEIELNIENCNFFLRPPPTGSFSLLTDLEIRCVQMDGGELGRVVSSPRCPHLRDLRLFVRKLQPVRDISISSESLQYFHWASTAEACRVVAPKLEKVVWLTTYDPGRHQFVVAGHYLRSLSIMHSRISSTRLMERFDTTSELTVNLILKKGIEGYTTFLKEMEKLPICETLVVHLMLKHHAFVPTVLHLLRRCSCIRKFKLFDYSPEMTSCNMPDCPCLLPENYRLDDIAFDSLEEIGIGYFTGSAEKVEFVELLLSRCNTVTTLKRVDFTVPFVPVSSEIMEAVQRISSMCHPNSKVQFKVHGMEDPKS